MRNRTTELITPDYAGAIVGEDVCVHVWRKTVDVEVIRATRRFVEQWDEQIRGVFVVIEEASTLPNEAARAEMARLHDNKRLEFLTIVCEGTGFKAAAVRAVLTGMHVINRLPYQTKVFAVVAGAAAWTVQNHGRLLGLTDLPSFVAGLRRRAHAQAA